MKHRIEFLNEVSDTPVDTGLKMLLCQAISKALKALDCPPAAITVILVDDTEIQRINLKQRGIDKVTDVLSFPLLDAKEGVLPPTDAADYEDGYLLLGDIVLCVHKARMQAKEFGHSVSRELAYLTVHSALHLLGFDHMEEEEQKKMRAMEEKVLSSMGLTRKE